jgi:hypothetical protein
MPPRTGLIFSPCKPRIWQGRYARIPGTTTAFHLRFRNGHWWPEVDWMVDDDTAHCQMIKTAGVTELVEAVLAGKRKLGSRGGGAFAINEYGQVLVPATDSDEAHVCLVGECQGRLRFENPFDPDVELDLSSRNGLTAGEPWNRPYVGIPHNLASNDFVYFKRSTAEGTVTTRPDMQDAALIGALRRVRPAGPVRFIVMPGGLVATKVEVSPGKWQPHYVGQINPAQWFAKEA